MTSSTLNPNRNISAQVLRWVARGWSLLSIGFVLLMFIGESAQSGFHITLKQLLGFSLFPIGVLLGMALAWRWEKSGAAITIVSLGLFYLWNFAVTGRFPSGPWFLLLAAPAFLFLSAALLRSSSQARLAPQA